MREKFIVIVTMNISDEQRLETIKEAVSELDQIFATELQYHSSVVIKACVKDSI